MLTGPILRKMGGITVVTNGNFASVLPSILHHLKEADFVAFDTELTGLCMGSSNKYFFYDDINERYKKLRESANNFGMIQFGLSAFKFKPSGSRYSSTSWSFHIFPVTSDSNNDFRKWTLQLSSIAFLRNNGFDFNKTFLEGIPYLSRKEEIDARGRSPTQQQQRTDKDVIMKLDDITFFESTIESVREWLKNEETSSEPLRLPPCNSFRRLIIHQNLPKQLNTSLTISKVRDEEGKDCLLLKNTSSEEKEAITSAAVETFEKNISEKIGIRRIFDFLLSSNKPLLGHNCWLDICHMWAKFIGPLPQEWNEFQIEYKKVFNAPLWDTKFLASQLIKDGTLTFTETSLEKLATAVDDKDVWGASVKVDGGKTKNKSKEEGFHHAGFDAYCTGKVLIGCATLLANKNNLPVNEMVSSLFENGLYKNTLNMMTSDYEGVRLIVESENGADSDFEQNHPDRSKLLVITGINSNICNSHIYSAISSIGCECEMTQLFWPNSNSVYASCPDFTPVECNLEIQVNGETVTCKCLPYDTWKEAPEFHLPSPKRTRS